MSWQFLPAVVRELRGLTIDRFSLDLSLTHSKGLSIVGFTDDRESLRLGVMGCPVPIGLPSGGNFI